MQKDLVNVAIYGGSNIRLQSDLTTKLFIPWKDEKALGWLPNDLLTSWSLSFVFYKLKSRRMIAVVVAVTNY